LQLKLYDLLTQNFILNKLSYIRKKLDIHTEEVIRGASVSFAVKVIAAILGFALNVVLVRLLGASNAGLYFLAFTVATIAATLGQAGLRNTFIRFVACNAAVDDWTKVKGIYKKGILIAIVASIVTSVIMFLLASWLAECLFKKPEMSKVLLWMALSVVPYALYMLFSSLLQGLKRIFEAMLVLSVLNPAFMIIISLILIPLKGIIGTAWAFILAAFLTLIIGIWRWNKSTSRFKGLNGYFKTSDMLQSSIPLFWVSILNLIIYWSSNLMLGMWGTSTDVAIFNVANRTSHLTNFILLAVNSIAAPKFATLFHQGDFKTLERIVRNSTKIMIIMAIPSLFFFIIIPRFVMGIFGPEFAENGLILMILGIGQFINVSTGSAGYLLIMCGQERIWRNNLALSSAINLVLNMTLIPSYGATGAALATAITLSLQMLIAVGLAKWKLAIMTIPIFKAQMKNL